MKWKQSAALGMASVLVFHMACVDLQAAPPQVRVDESVYVNLDYYGAVEEVNIVKGCMLNGNTSIVDYGDYNEVVNMSNRAVPQVEAGRVTWDLSGQEGERFYFECKTDRLAQELPWDLDVTYRLNGKECSGDELAGAAGMVTMLVTVEPNPAAPEYYRNNMILTVATLVLLEVAVTAPSPARVTAMVLAVVALFSVMLDLFRDRLPAAFPMVQLADFAVVVPSLHL